MSAKSHVPIRLCIGCGARAPQRELLRLVRSLGGSLVLSDRGRGGRGGYLHRREACWTAFAVRRGVVRSLGHAVDRGARAAFVQELQGRELAAIKR